VYYNGFFLPFVPLVSSENIRAIFASFFQLVNTDACDLYMLESPSSRSERAQMPLLHYRRRLLVVDLANGNTGQPSLAVAKAFLTPSQHAIEQAHLASTTLRSSANHHCRISLDLKAACVR
jgi:hypothetical protein